MSDSFCPDCMQVLVVDSDPKCKLLPGLILRPFGFIVHEVTSGIEAACFLSRHRPDVVIWGHIESGLTEMLGVMEDKERRSSICVKYGSGGIDAPCDYSIKRPAVSLELLKTVETIMLGQSDGFEGLGGD